jgi:hypothetical protein
MVRSLKALCFIFTGTVALFVLVNLVAAYFYPRTTLAVLSDHPVFDDAMRPTWERIYQLPISVVRETVAECWMENAWIFEPYVQFRERPRVGQFVNISPDGFRLNAKEGRKAFDPAAKAVFVFGGSTTFGYGVRDQDTIAAHLEAIFRERQPEQRVAVYNFGRGYYGSSQEFLLLKLLVQRGIVPHVAIFMDGVNEHYCPTYSANIAEMFKIAQEDPSAKLRAVLTSLPVLRLSRTPYRTELAQNALYRNRAIASYSFECGCHVEATCPTQFVNTFVLNKQLIRAIGKQFGFESHFILQPVGGYKNRFTTSPYNTPIPDRTAQWQYFEQHMMNGEGDHSFAGILEHIPGDAFVDNLHYTSATHQLIAAAIYASVAHSLAKTVRSQ